MFPAFVFTASAAASYFTQPSHSLGAQSDFSNRWWVVRTWTVACGWSPTALVLWFPAVFEYYATDPIRLACLDLKHILKWSLRLLWLDGSSSIENIYLYSFCFTAMKEGWIKVWVSSLSEIFTTLTTDSACEAEAFSLWGVWVTLKQDAALPFSVCTQKISPKIYKCFFFSKHRHWKERWGWWRRTLKYG